jgi:hypothetical protein
MGTLLRRKRRARGALAVGVLAGVGAAIGCGPDRVEVQALPPEVEALNDVYDTPTGTVPASAMQQIQALQQTLDTLAQSHLVDVVDQSLVRLRERAQEGGLTPDPSTRPTEHAPRITGTVTITQTCRGWDPAVTIPNPADGTIQLVAQFDGSVLQRTILGTATNCRGRIDVPNGPSLNVFLNGSIALFLEGPLPANAEQATFLMAWSGTLGTPNAMADGSFDFRVVPPLLEVRIPVSDGDIIGAVGAGGVTLRGANGTFGCSLQTFECGPS